jgi:ribosomal-protein-alanine N-acetyltransferase
VNSIESLELRTERLLLRRWTPGDRGPFAELNADPDVMEFFPALLSRADSDAFVDRIEASFEQHCFGLWAAELFGSGEFIGYIGLWPATFDAHFTPAIEVGWRLARRHWGSGYAPEGARAAVADGFDRLGVDEIVSITAAINHRSRRVMEKLGMTHDPLDDFEHPALPVGHALRPHVLYRMSPARAMRSGGPVSAAGS